MWSIKLTILLILNSFNVLALVPVDIPKSCSNLEGIKITSNDLGCTQYESSFSIGIKNSLLSHSNETAKKWEWIVSRTDRLLTITNRQIDQSKPLFRYITNSSGLEDKQRASLKKRYRTLYTNYTLLKDVILEIEIVKKTISRFKRQRVGYFVRDLVLKRRELQKLKIALLVESPQLSGANIEDLIKKKVKAGKSPIEAEFKQALRSDMVAMFAFAKDQKSKYVDFLMNAAAHLNRKSQKTDEFLKTIKYNFPEVLRNIFSSGMGQLSFDDKLYAGPSCYFAKMYNSQLKTDAIIETTTNIALFAAPFIPFGAGHGARLLGSARMLSWGTKMGPKVAARAKTYFTLGAESAIILSDQSRMKKHELKCQALQSQLLETPSKEFYKNFKKCRSDYAFNEMLSLVSIGATSIVGGAVVLSPLLRGKFLHKLSTRNSNKHNLMQDLGLSNRKAISMALKEMQNVKEVGRGLSTKVVNKRAALNAFKDASLIATKSSGTSGYIPIDSSLLKKYLKEVGSNTVEVLHIPGVDIPYLSENLKQVGHIAFRVGGKVYHQTGTKGFRIETMKNFLEKTKKGHHVFGEVLQVSPREKAVMKKYFERLHEKQVPYSFLLNNCSQSACRALKAAEVEDITGAAKIDPYFLGSKITESKRSIGRTVYNSNQNEDLAAVANKARNMRILVWGFPVLGSTAAAAGTGTIAYDQYIEYFSK